MFDLQAVTQIQESLQQQVERVDSLLEEADRRNLPTSLIHQAVRLQVRQPYRLIPG